MKLNKIFLPILAVAAMFGSVACTDEVEYTPAPEVNSPAVYFSPMMGTSYSILDGSKNFNVPVYRANAGEAQTVNVEFSVDPQGPFTVEPTVTFEAEETKANIVVAYELDKLIVGQQYSITLTLPDVEATAYANNKAVVTCSFVPWQPVGPEEAESMGWYRDDFIPTLFELDCYEWKVRIEEHPVNEGVYRLVDPYLYFYEEVAGGAWYDDSKNHYMIINAHESSAVYIQNFWSGYCINDEYGECVMTSLAYLNMAKGETLADQVAAGLTGTLEDGFIRFPEKSLLFGMELYKDLALYYANSHGMFKVVLPGYENEPEWVPYGWCKYTDGLCSELAKNPGHSYEVYVEKSNVNEGIYRVVDLFGPESGYVTTAPENPVYTVFDASNKECVLIGETKTPFKDRIKGEITVTTVADILWSSDDGGEYDAIIKAGYGGTLKNNKITIPGSQVRYKYSRNQSIGTPKIPIEVILDLNNPRVPEVEPDTPEEASRLNVFKGEVLPTAILCRMFNARNIER